MFDGVPEVAPMSRGRIEAIARELVEIVQPEVLTGGAAFPILEICEGGALEQVTGFVFGVENLPYGSEGQTRPGSPGELVISPAVYDALGRDDGRARFTLAHELGHVVLHATQLQAMNRQIGELVLHRRFSLPAYRDPEWQADQFAAALLMPMDGVRAVIARSGNSAHTVASVFRTSFTAAAKRCRAA